MQEIIQVVSSLFNLKVFYQQNSSIMYYRHILLLVAALTATAAVYFQRNGQTQIKPKTYPGRNNTVLFLTNSDSGHANVVLAASHSLLVGHSDLEVHYGTFRNFDKPIQDINKWVATKSAGTGQIKFHEIQGHDFAATFKTKGLAEEYHVNPPGLAGFQRFSKSFHMYMMPWDAPEYLEIYKQVVALIEQLDPAVVVLDVLFAPGIDATRVLKRREVIISPNSVKDTFIDLQPLLSMFWKYPL